MSTGQTGSTGIKASSTGIVPCRGPTAHSVLASFLRYPSPQSSSSGWSRQALSSGLSRILLQCDYHMFEVMEGEVDVLGLT